MRKVVASPFYSLDGVTEAPDQWQEHFDDDMMAVLQAAIAESDTILMGRVTYDEWHTYWPTATDEPFASYINNAPKYVVSTTLSAVDWGPFNNISLIKGNLVEEITRLKQQPGKNIAVQGSPGLVRSLLQHNLLDEIMLTIHPVFAGRGKHLVKDGDGKTNLELLKSITTRTGSIIATYKILPKA